ncbi:hypothetical protein ACHAXR_003335 [Thalassiosira sp. AJA248-18]
MMRFVSFLFVGLMAHLATTATAVRRISPPLSLLPTPPTSLTFTALAGPLPLYPGEITNSWHHIRIPKGPIAISEFSADIVEKDPSSSFSSSNSNGNPDDEEKHNMIPVPLSEAYLHHHVVNSEHKFHNNNRHPLLVKSSGQSSHGVGFGAGTESRGTQQKFPYPYRFTTVVGEDELLANVHIINTRNMTMEDAHHCLECPCTMEDYSVIQQRKTHWRNETCNDALIEEENDSCFSDRYKGGLFCCEDGEFCLDKYYNMSKSKEDKDEEVSSSDSNSSSVQSIFYLRYVITYTPTTPDIQPLYLAACCDATGDETLPGNIEYDIPKCTTNNDKRSDDCIHELETIQSLHGEATASFGLGGTANEEDTYVDIVYMVGHLHRGGVSMSSYLMNGTALCISLPTYGTGVSKEIGNEPGYINSMSSCTFDPPLRMRTTDKIRVVGRYNSSEAHTGVMSLFYIAIADIDGVVMLESSKELPSGYDNNGGMWKYAHSWTGRIVLGCAVIVIGVMYYCSVLANFKDRRGYEPVPNSGLELSS